MMLGTSMRNFRNYFTSSVSMASARRNIKRQLRMDSLPAYRLPHDIVEYESGKKPSESLQEKFM